MTITTISDLHGYLPLLQPCDVVCICGDISPIEFDRNKNKVREWFINKFIPWVKMLDCQKVIFIAGNHDFFLYINDDGYSVKQVIENSDVKNKLVYLENEEYVYNRLKFYGCPNVEQLAHWAFYTWDGHEYKYIPKDTDILLTHMAPAIGELGRDFTVVRDFGSRKLATAIQNLPNLRYAFCGHIHDGDHKPTLVNHTVCINSAILNDDYDYAYEPVTIDIQMIQLPNRDGDENYLLFQGVENDLYIYDLRLEHDFGTRVIGGDDPDEIIAVDPSGGPMISIGYQIQVGELTLELVEIKDFKLKFKNAKDEEIV
jgi:Icc-related predicted phosphoesterase